MNIDRQVMPKLAIIHTTAVTVGALKELVNEIIPGCQIYNFMDDSILPQLIRGENIAGVEKRVHTYVRFAQDVNADVILSACSSIGEMVEMASELVQAPVLRIDECMAELAVAHGQKIGVAATLGTTLKPTVNLLSRKAANTGKNVEFFPQLIESAYEQLMHGDQNRHDELVAMALADMACQCDVVVLAQASMARVLTALPAEDRGKFLTSPRSGVTRVKDVLERIKGL